MGARMFPTVASTDDAPRRRWLNRRGWAAIIGMPTALALMYYANFDTIDRYRRLAHSSNVIASHMLTVMATAAMLGCLATLYKAEVTRKCQLPRGLTTPQALGFYSIAGVFFALALAIWAIAAHVYNVT